MQATNTGISGSCDSIEPAGLAVRFLLQLMQSKRNVDSGSAVLVDCAQPGICRDPVLSSRQVVRGLSNTVVSRPEPSTWAMMVLGFAGVESMSDHRKQKAAFC
jgi:hypothetical protein